MEQPAAVRARYWHGEADLGGEVDGRPVRAAQLSIRSMNFGQHWRTPGVRDIRYSVTLPLAFVAHLLGRELPEYVADCMAHPDTDPFEAALRSRQWPNAKQVLEDAELCPLALGWFGQDCLLGWLGDGEPGATPGYVINTIEVAERREDAVRFMGAARAIGQPVQYQDV